MQQICKYPTAGISLVFVQKGFVDRQYTLLIARECNLLFNAFVVQHKYQDILFLLESLGKQCFYFYTNFLPFALRGQKNIRDDEELLKWVKGIHVAL